MALEFLAQASMKPRPKSLTLPKRPETALTIEAGNDGFGKGREMTIRRKNGPDLSADGSFLGGKWRLHRHGIRRERLACGTCGRFTGVGVVRHNGLRHQSLSRKRNGNGSQHQEWEDGKPRGWERAGLHEGE